MSVIPAVSQTLRFNISLGHNLVHLIFYMVLLFNIYITVSYSTKVSQNEGIITLFSPRVFSDNVFDGYDEIFVLYSHLAMDKTYTVN